MPPAPADPQVRTAENPTLPCTMSASQSLLPREYGAYAQLGFPLCCGLVMGGVSAAGLAFGGAAVAGRIISSVKEASPRALLKK